MSINVNDVFNRDAFEGTNGGNGGKKLLKTLKRQLSTNQEYYAVCISDKDEKFFPIKLTKTQAEVYGKEDSLKTIVDYLKTLYPEKAEDIQQHAMQIMPLKKLKVPERLKESAKKEADTRLKEYDREAIIANKQEEIKEHLREFPKDLHVYLVMKIKDEETSSGIADLIAKLPYEKAFELSLAGDLSEFVTIPDIIEMYEYDEIPRFVSEKERELRNFLDNQFLKNKKPLEITDRSGKRMLVKPATGEDRKKMINGVWYYKYLISPNGGTFSRKEWKSVYSFTSPDFIARNLARGEFTQCQRLVNQLSNMFAVDIYCNIGESSANNIGGIIEGKPGSTGYSYTYSMTKPTEVSNSRKVVLVMEITKDATSGEVENSLVRDTQGTQEEGRAS